MSKKYVITNGKSYVRDKLNIVTEDLNEARVFNSFDLANNVYKNSIPKSFKQMGFQVKEIEINTNEKINSSYTEVNVEGLKKIINDLSEKFTTLKGNKE